MRIVSFAALSLLLGAAACTPNSDPGSQTTASATAEAPLPAKAEAVAPGAEAPGKRVAKDGEMCGGIAGIACADGSYCATELKQCEVADGAGVCRTKPTACTEQFEPVCGCDAKTYSNACKAAMSGLNVDVTGECQ